MNSEIPYTTEPTTSDVSTPPDALRVSVVIPCYREASVVRQCLESIDATDFPKDRLEVFVIDGMSNDGTRTIVEQFAATHSYVRMLDNPKKIASAALNIGIAASKGDVIIRMDAHAEYPPNYISSLVYWLDKSGADNVGGICVTSPANDGVCAKAIAFGMSHPVGVGDSYFRIGVERPRWVDTVPFGCYRREVFDRIGGFDEDLIRNQDDELNARLLCAGGHILLVPEITCRYFARDSLGKLWRMFYQYGYFKPLATKKLKHLTTLRQLAPPLLITTLLASAVLSFWSVLAVALLCLLLGAYAGMLVLGVWQASRDHDWLTALAVLPVFLTLHFGYGFGYIRGIVDFWMLRRKPSDQLMQITTTR